MSLLMHSRERNMSECRGWSARMAPGWTSSKRNTWSKPWFQTLKHYAWKSESSEHLPNVLFWFCLLCLFYFSALFPSNSRQLLSKSIPPRCIYPGHIFTPSHLCGNVTYFSPLHSFCCRHFLKKVPKAEIFIVTFPFLPPEPAMCWQASSLGSDVQNAFSMLKMRSLRCSLPCLVHCLTSSMEHPAA